MKKLIALALAVVMVLSLGACSVQKAETPAPTAAPAPAATEAHIRLRNTQLLEESIGHILVVVLPRMHQTIVHIFPCRLRRFYRTDDRRYLHKVGACPCNQCNQHN